MVDWALRGKFRNIDMEFDQFRKRIEEKYGVFLGHTGSIEHNSLTIMMRGEDAKKCLSPRKLAEWRKHQP